MFESEENPQEIRSENPTNSHQIATKFPIQIWKVSRKYFIPNQIFLKYFRIRSFLPIFFPLKNFLQKAQFKKNHQIWEIFCFSIVFFWWERVGDWRGKILSTDYCFLIFEEIAGKSHNNFFFFKFKIFPHFFSNSFFSVKFPLYFFLDFSTTIPPKNPQKFPPQSRFEFPVDPPRPQPTYYHLKSLNQYPSLRVK